MALSVAQPAEPAQNQPHARGGRRADQCATHHVERIMDLCQHVIAAALDCICPYFTITGRKCKNGGGLFTRLTSKEKAF